MKDKRCLRAGWLLLLATFVIGLAAPPAYAAEQSNHAVHGRLDTTPINATVYLATGTLAPIFRDRIAQMVPGRVNSALNDVVNSLPPADQGWAMQMATALIQPSGTLMSLAPQAGGIGALVRVSLYPGDPQPIDANLLFKFSVLDASTVQVSAQPVNGSPALVNGPITTFHVPFGSLSGINATPTCGSAALAVNMQIPLTLGNTGTTGQQSANSASDISSSQLTLASFERSAGESNSYVEIPASSLAALGGSIGSLPINNQLTAQNIQVAVSGSNLVITSDIMLGTSLQLGTATTTVEPTAENGSLAVHVLNTDLTVLQLFTFPYNTYNRQIEQTLNTKLNSAFAGKFNVTNAAIGGNSSLPCAAGDSLVLTGTTSFL